MNKIEAVIFDMDGVLIDAKDWHYEALNRALSHFGCSISRYDHLVTYDGLPTLKKLEMLSLERGLPKDLHPFINELKQTYTMELVFTQCKPIFEHEYALSKLSAMQYKLGLASNAVTNSVCTMLEKANLFHYFDVVLSNQDVTRAKPDPEIYNTAISALGLRPEQCMVVEDNEKGIKAAKAAKAHLMVVEDVYGVTLSNILTHIRRFESEAL